MELKFALLSDKFREKYPTELFPEIEQKDGRPYLVLVLQTRDGIFAIPFRHKIRHRYAFITNREEQWGIDYTKAVVIADESFITTKTRRNQPIEITNSEFFTIKENIKKILLEFNLYIEYYKKLMQNNPNSQNPVLKFSTLQYFHTELGLPAS